MSQMGPLVGAIVPVCIMLFGRVALNVQFDLEQLAAVALLILGSVIIAAEKRSRTISFQRSGWYALLAGVCFAIAHLTSKYFYVRYDFLTGLVWTKGPMALGGFLLICLPSVRAFLFAPKSKQISVPEARHSRFAALAFVDQSFGAIGTLCLEYAMNLGNIAVVNALNGVQYVVLIGLVAVFSRLNPKIIKEEYTRFKIAQEIVAVVLIGAGLWLLMF